jgi:glyoxylase-like metal-dependent hydrolase (beta-lactamase superfamily II)
MFAHIEGGLRSTPPARLRPLDRDTVLTPGVEAVLAPGHTPGHLAVAIESDGDRVLLLGDAITAPEQLTEAGWHSMGDVDAAEAERSRQALCARIAATGALATGAHFRELRFGTLHDGRWTPAHR